MIRSEVKAAAGQPVTVAEFFHPRIEEVAALLPVGWGSGLLKVSDCKALVESTPWALER